MKCGKVGLAFLIGLAMGATAPGADGPAPDGPRRVVEGRCLDPAGRPPRDGRISFSPGDDVRATASGAWSARLDAEGRYRVELAPYIDPNTDGEVIVPTVALRSRVLATDFRVEVGAVEPGAGPARVDVRLVPRAWPATTFDLRDAAGRPVAGAEVALTLDASGTWAQARSDAAGECRLAHPPEASFGITARRAGGLTTSLGLRGAADDPPRIVIPLREPIRGRVVDEAGRPCPGVAVGGRLGFDRRARDPAARRRPIVEPSLGSRETTTTDADGRFALVAELQLDSRRGIDPRTGAFRLGQESVCVADAEALRVAFVGVDWGDPRPSYEIPLRPARRVTVPIEHEIAIPPGDVETQWSLTCLTDVFGAATAIRTMYGVAAEDPRAGIGVGVGAGVDTATIEASWPPGHYQLWIDTVNERLLERVERADIVVPPGEGPIRLPTIRLAIPANKRLVGRPAPEIDARDLDTGAPVRLADLRGRVVLLDFWGYWCGPCLGSMPDLIRLHEQFRGQPVAILALHDESVQSRGAYDARLDGVRRDVWAGRDLPFPVALDRPDPARPADETPIGRGVTCDRYQVRGFPTTYLIDQDGKVVAQVNARQPDQVAARIRELLAARPPAR